MLNYLISTTKNGSCKKETIHDPESKLKMKVFDLVKSKYRPKDGEVSYFGTAGDEKIALETEGYKKQKNLIACRKKCVRQNTQKQPFAPINAQSNERSMYIHNTQGASEFRAPCDWTE